MIIIIFSIIIILIFYVINYYLNKTENFCYGNVYCNGNKNNALCINQNCKECGVTSSKCISNSDCGPNLCIKGCCDTM
jgi:hypothetical protein